MGGWVRMDLTGIGWEDVEWSHLAQCRDWEQAVVNMMVNLQVRVPHSSLCTVLSNVLLTVPFL